MSPMLWTVLVPICGAAAWLLVRRSVREVLEDYGAGRARDQFRLRREGLEARFLTQLEPVEKLRWDEARWRDDVVLARDRRSRRLMAMVGVSFEPDPFDPSPQFATAIFEYRRGRWHAEGKRLDEIRPDEAFSRHHRLEPVVLPQRRV